MRIDIFQDNVCPWCRIGKANLFRALDQYGGEKPSIHWRAFMLDPTVPEEGLPFLSTMKQKFGERFSEEAMFGRVVEAGAAAGLTFHFGKVAYMPNTRLSHRLIAIAPDAAKQGLVEALHKAYFEQGRNIGDRAVLLELAGESGLAADALAAALDRGEGEAEVEADFAFARKVGISGVPFFILNNKYALSGAQPPESFLKVFARLEEEQEQA